MFSSAQRASAVAFGTSFRECQGVTATAAGQWYVVVGTFESDTVRTIYLNGRYENTASVAAGTNPAAWTAANIGKLPRLTVNYYFTANLTAAAVLNKALSAAEVAAWLSTPEQVLGLFRSPTRKVWLDAVAGATFNAAWARPSSGIIGAGMGVM